MSTTDHTPLSRPGAEHPVEKLEAQVAAEQSAYAELANALTEAHKKVANLEIGLETARRIGIAVGILMAHHHVTDVQAFQLLRRTSQQTHRKLRDIAEDVLLTGALPDH